MAQPWPSWSENPRTVVKKIQNVTKQLSPFGRWLMMLLMVMMMMLMLLMMMVIIIIIILVETTSFQDENEKVEENSAHFRRVVDKINNGVKQRKKK